MFTMFIEGAQQDIKLILIPVIISAIFRFLFIYLYGNGEKNALYYKKVRLSLWFGFLWGLDFHAYVYLLSLLCITIPSVFVVSYANIADSLRCLWVVVYALCLYVAFMGKMIFYGEFHDIYNQTMLLGKNADKGNFVDIFLHQYHGWIILLGIIPYSIIVYFLTAGILVTPVIPYLLIDNTFLRYLVNFFFFVLAGVGFYWIRYGGHLSHLFKPSRNNMPTLLKNDPFFSKATVDDLIAIELVLKQQEKKILKHTEEESTQILIPLFGKTDQMKNRDWSFFLRHAKGAKIRKPKHIYFIVGESYTQVPFDEKYKDLHLVDGGKAFRQSEHTIAVSNFLPAGLISQPSLASLFSGIFDANFEINEMPIFQRKQVPTAFAAQMQRLGYHTAYWYGGNTAWASLGRFGKAQGFEIQKGAPEFCPSDSPHTWLGIYDHIFFEGLYEEICKLDPELPMFHLIYTTSNHPPYTIPVRKFGFDPDRIMPNLSADIRQDSKLLNNLGMYWYADHYMSQFIHKVQMLDEDSLIIVTGDHSRLIIPFDTEMYSQKNPTLREKYCTSFAMYHPDLQQSMFYQTKIGGHMNIMPTVLELIAPKGFEYYSIVPSFLEPIESVITPYHWLTSDMIGYYEDAIASSLEDTEREQTKGITCFYKERQAWCEWTAWIIKHPELLH